MMWRRTSLFEDLIERFFSESRFLIPNPTDEHSINALLPQKSWGPSMPSTEMNPCSGVPILKVTFTSAKLGYTVLKSPEVATSDMMINNPFELKVNCFHRKPCTVGRHRLGPEHVQISTPQAWSHPNTMRASGARALGGMFCNARATHTAKLCPKNTGAKTQKCWDKKSCAGSAGAKKVYAGHASHTLAHCFQEMSACMIADI